MYGRIEMDLYFEIILEFPLLKIGTTQQFSASQENSQ